MRKYLAMLLLFAACTPSMPAADAPQRVVSLGGDITETIYALEAQGKLVGVDSTSEWPDAAHKLPNVGYVRQLNAEGILALRPTEVIATHDAGPAAVLEQLRGAGVTLHLLPASRAPQDVLAKVSEVGQLLGADAQAQSLNSRLTHTYADLHARVAAMQQHPRVVFLLSAGAGQFLAAGRDTAADAAIALAGGSNAVQAYSGYKPLSAEALVAAAPQVLVVMSERSDGSGDSAAVLALPGVAQTPAGKHRQIVFVDGQALLGFGPRNAQSELTLQSRLAAVQP
ncbi:heme/hemin ABC transporter substrate-binding protein [Dyella acidiphila]|uniref:ABC transporter substrate-binding protein n=1 Tax=Dyella acidiphila TaxID=2775866 RepID=A0ABR9GEH8_9GAMM|nr:ABC transporter substrate-binding protein [Dyella acidiphila]MBE1162425.1 ABC transporter substrate-binding protein [Dyella acidiphila]